jgi:hypothetical protein
MHRPIRSPLEKLRGHSVQRILAIGLLSLAAARMAPADVPSAIAIVKGVGHDGAGHAAAQPALQELSRAGVESLDELLAAMDGANPLAANWLRGAFEAVAAQGLAAPDGLKVEPLLAYYNDRSHDPKARRLAFEWIVAAQPERREDLIAAALDDPSVEMRRDAVDRLLAQAKAASDAGDAKAAAETYRAALGGANEPQQVEPIAKALEQLGQPIDLVDHYGLLTDWYVIGPFDNKELKGFPVDYPPEHGVDLNAAYAGQKGEVRWQKLTTQDKEGIFDLAALTEPHKGAVDYVTTEFTSDRDQPVEFRIGTQNAWKLWLNGELVFAREEYHRGRQFDQYRVAGELKAGPNRILMKVCQNEQDQSWAQEWRFQFRVCDPYGRALRPTMNVAKTPGTASD